MADGFLNSGSNNPRPQPIVLRFRPIAPKPFNGVAVPLPSLPISRSKRKYVARRRNPPRGRRIRRRAAPKPLVLKQPLLFPGKVAEPSPRTKARDGSKAAGPGSSQLVKSFYREAYENTPASPRVTTPGHPLLPDLNEVVSGTPPPDPRGDETPLPRSRRVLETWLIVESVAADARCIQRVGLQQQQEEVVGKNMTDEERVRRLVSDTCPGFVTDEENLIRWVNGACERMVRERLSTAGGGVAAVWVVTREELPYGCPAFTCRVRIVYTWQDEGRPMWWPGGQGVSVALCDAWRLDSGGFAWRLDVEAALSLAPAEGS